MNTDVVKNGAGTRAPELERLGRYELIARIGVGGMAEVYLARQRGPMGFEKVVVVKKIHSHLAREQEFMDWGLGMFVHWDHASQQGLEISWPLAGGNFERG